MADIDYTKLQQDLSKGNVKSLYCLYGEEAFLIDEALKKLTQVALGSGLADFNLDVFYGGEAKIEVVMDALDTLPMMGPKRVVILKEGASVKAKELEKLQSIVSKPIETSTFVFVSQKIDKRKKFFKDFSKKGIMVKLDRPFENQLPKWIQFIAQKHGLKISQEALELIQEYVGPNLMDMNNEMLKLSQYLGDRSEVSVEDVKSVVSRVRIETVFALAEAIGQANGESALLALARLLENGENPIGVLAIVSRHFRILLLVKEGIKQGLSNAQLSSRVGVPGFFIRQYIDQSQVWSDNALKSILGVLLDTDRALKSSPLSSHIWLENFIIKSCGLRGPRALPMQSY